jgi:Fe-S-cluster containining protein
MNFECQASCKGKCCTVSWKDSDSYVFLTKQDRERLSKFLGVPETDFAKQSFFTGTRFFSKPSKQWVLTIKETCPFLKDGQCSVYEARPTQCRTFPYWPENFAPDLDFKHELELYCPGIGKGTSRKAKYYLAMQELADRELRGQI